MFTARTTLTAFTFCMSVFLAPAAWAVSAEQQKLLNQLDQLDQLDHQEFLDKNAKANACIQDRDFDCAERLIARSDRLAKTAQDKALLAMTQQNFDMEHELQDSEQQIIRDREEAEERARAKAEQARRAQERAEEEEAERQRLKYAAMSAGFLLGGGGQLSAERQAQLMNAIARDSQLQGSDASNFNDAANDISEQQQVQARKQERILARQRELLARQSEAIAAAEAAPRGATMAVAPAVTRAATAAPPKTAPQIVQYVPQTVQITDWSKPCPPGSSPARNPNGTNVVAGSGGAYCLKDKTSGQSAEQANSNQAGNAFATSGGTASSKPGADQIASAASPTLTSADEKAADAQRKADLAERKRQEQAEAEKARPDAVAFCWQSDKGYWNCDGPGDETSIGDKDQNVQLSSVGCKIPSRMVDGQVTLNSTKGKPRTKTGWLYFCGKKLQAGDTGALTWNRDIRKFWSGIPQ